jgi:transcriptional regulator with XRE-family HTH domain
MSSEELDAGQGRGGDLPELRPSLTIAETAQACGLSISTIRRYLRAGRFPSARQEPSLIPGQPGQWRIPTEDVLGAGLNRGRPTPSDHGEGRQFPTAPAGGRSAEDRIKALEHVLELERTRRQAAEGLAAERARTIRMLEMALGALEDRGPGGRPYQPGTATSASWSSDPASDQTAAVSPTARYPPDGPRLRPRRAKGDLSQEERAAIIGRALSGERPPKRRWWWQ